MSLTIGTTHAADGEYECQVKLIQAESVFEQKMKKKLLSDTDVESINLLLDEADEACTLGDQKGVDEALDKVNGIVSSARKSSQKDQ